MILGAESYDYLSPQITVPYNTSQLTALGYYHIINDLVASTNTRFNYGNSMKFVAGGVNGARAVWLLPNGPQPDVAFMGIAIFIGDTAELDHPHIVMFNSGMDAGAVGLTFMPFGILRVNVGDVINGAPQGDVIYTSPGGTYRLNTWFYIEIAVKVDPATVTPTGTMRLRLNTEQIADYINITTGSPGVTFVDSIKWGFDTLPNDVTRQYYWDDIYVLDDVPSADGPANNSFLGNVRVQGLLPAGPGDNTDFSKFGAATNWQAARNQKVDDTSYVFSPTPGEYDLYTIDPIINTPNVYAVQVKGAYRQDDATQRFAVNTVKSGSTQVDGTPHAVNGNYSFQWDIFSADPNTTMTWAYADVNLLQIGPKVDS